MSTVRTGLIRVVVDYENNAVPWWDAARLAPDCPPELRPLIHGTEDEVEIRSERFESIQTWCALLPGWDSGPGYARTALRFSKGER